MADKKTYRSLDDIGFLGTKKERSEAEISTDAKRTSAYVTAYKASAKIADRSVAGRAKISHTVKK